MKKCANCYWFDQCAQEKACEYYDPLDPFELAVEAYEKELKLRAKAYQKIIDELERDPLEEAIKEIEKADQRREENVEQSI